MSERSSLARWTDSASRVALPLADRVVGWARRSGQELRRRMLGEEFGQRMLEIRRHYAGAGPDPYGLDPDTLEKAAKFWAFFHRFYFRTEVHGIENLPTGRVVLVANHSGQVPIDAAILGCALFFDAPKPRVVRAMIDRWAAGLPFVASFFSRIGSVVGAPSNARHLLEDGEAVLVFPEGIRGISKPFSQRYEMAEFGHGFLRVALATQSPILPVAVIGAEEQYINLGNSDWLARKLRMPVFPIIPQLAVPGGQLPLPTKYRLHFGEPLTFHGDADAADATIRNQVSVVRAALQQLVLQGLSRRRSAFY